MLWEMAMAVHWTEPTPGVRPGERARREDESYGESAASSPEGSLGWVRRGPLASLVGSRIDRGWLTNADRACDGAGQAVAGRPRQKSPR